VKTATKVFVGSGIFAAVVAVVYWYVAFEDAGTTLLAFMSLMLLTVAGYLIVLGALRRRKPLPEDRPDASPGDGADVVGSFPLSSAWPVVMAGGLVVFGAGLVYGVLLLPLGGLIFAGAVIGLMRESRS
jgi:cytochrome c oxidase subunit IV